MITCPECGKEYSNQAKACVHCGAKNPRRKSHAGILAGVLLVLVVLFVPYVMSFGPSGSTGDSVTKDELCSQSAEAAHYIAALSGGQGNVVQVTDQVIANKKYPLLGDKVVASIGAVVALNSGSQTPDEISTTVRNTCEQGTQQ